MKWFLPVMLAIVLFAAAAVAVYAVKSPDGASEAHAPKQAVSAKELGFVEHPLDENAVTMISAAAVNFFTGDSLIRFDLPGYEVELTTDNGSIWVPSLIEKEGYGFAKTRRFLCGESPVQACVCDPTGPRGYLPDGTPYGHVDADGVTLTAILRRDGRIAGYVVAASWGEYDDMLYNHRVIKAVELTAPDGGAADVTEAQVRELIADTVRQEIYDKGLFETNPYVPGEPVGVPEN